jgi:hypothetical protein
MTLMSFFNRDKSFFWGVRFRNFENSTWVRSSSFTGFQRSVKNEDLTRLFFLKEQLPGKVFDIDTGSIIEF